MRESVRERGLGNSSVEAWSQGGNDLKATMEHWGADPLPDVLSFTFSIALEDRGVFMMVSSLLNTGFPTIIIYDSCMLKTTRTYGRAHIAILIYLNEQVEGLIIDKKAEKDSRAEALLHYCCCPPIVTVYCFIVQWNCLPGWTHWDTSHSDKRAWFRIPAYQSTRLWFARRDHTGQPQMPGTCSPDIHRRDGVYTDSPGLWADSPPNDSSPSPS